MIRSIGDDVPSLQSKAALDATLAGTHTNTNSERVEKISPPIDLDFVILVFSPSLDDYRSYISNVVVSSSSPTPPPFKIGVQPNTFSNDRLSFFSATAGGGSRRWIRSMWRCHTHLYPKRFPQPSSVHSNGSIDAAAWTFLICTFKLYLVAYSLSQST